MKNSVAYQWAGLLGWVFFMFCGLPAFLIGIKFHYMSLVWFGIGIFFIAILLLAAMLISIWIGIGNEHKENMKELGPAPIPSAAMSKSTHKIMDFFSKDKE